MSLKIRPYSEKDYQYTHDLHRENMITYIDKYWGGWNSDVYKQDVRPENTWIIEHNGQMAGFFVLTFQEKAHLANIQIHSLFRDKGLGTQVLHYCEIESVKRGFDHLYLESFLDNQARHLYERLGFRTYKKTNSHYMMKKELNIRAELGSKTKGYRCGSE